MCHLSPLLWPAGLYAVGRIVTGVLMSSGEPRQRNLCRKPLSKDRGFLRVWRSPDASDVSPGLIPTRAHEGFNTGVVSDASAGPANKCIAPRGPALFGAGGRGPATAAHRHLHPNFLVWV